METSFGQEKSIVLFLYITVLITLINVITNGNFRNYTIQKTRTICENQDSNVSGAIRLLLIPWTTEDWNETKT